MNDFQSRGDIHVEMEDVNNEAATLIATIKKNLEELEI